MAINFSELLKSELKKQNLSQLDLAKKSGLSPQLICKYVSGVRVPSFFNADKLLRGLGITLKIGKNSDIFKL